MYPAFYMQIFSLCFSMTIELITVNRYYLLTLHYEWSDEVTDNERLKIHLSYVESYIIYK